MYQNILETIGNTPLIETKEDGINAQIFVKVESFNPSGSVKIRIAKHMIDKALKRGVINKDSILIEPTSGNTGIGLALVAAVYKMRFIAVMPSSMTIERRNFMKAYGAEIVLTDSKLGMKGAIAKAEELNKEIENSFIPSQFENFDNPSIHYLTTAKEIDRDLNHVDILVAGIGTGGTISGVGKYFKEKNPNVKLIGVEPANSPVLQGGKPGTHRIQGIGAGFVPKVLNREILDEVIGVPDEEALSTARHLSKTHGLFVGVSSGAAYYAALEVAKRKENKGLNIVVVLPDGGERYLSTNLVENAE